jgi:hypothetical protein
MNATNEKQKSKVWFIAGISHPPPLSKAISSSAQPATGNPTLMYR